MRPGNNAAGSSTFAAEVRITSEQPIFVLEHYDHLLHSVSCNSGTITLSFTRDAALSSNDLHSLVDGHIITSYYGCNEAGERAPYRVVGIESVSLPTITFVVEPANWKNSFATNVEMRHSRERHAIRPHWPRNLNPIYARSASGSGSVAPSVSVCQSLICWLVFRKQCHLPAVVS